MGSLLANIATQTCCGWQRFGNLSPEVYVWCLYRAGPEFAGRGFQ